MTSNVDTNYRTFLSHEIAYKTNGILKLIGPVDLNLLLTALEFEYIGARLSQYRQFEGTNAVSQVWRFPIQYHKFEGTNTVPPV